MNKDPGVEPRTTVDLDENIVFRLRRCKMREVSGRESSLSSRFLSHLTTSNSKEVEVCTDRRK